MYESRNRAGERKDQRQSKRCPRRQAVEQTNKAKQFLGARKSMKKKQDKCARIRGACMIVANELLIVRSCEGAAKVKETAGIV
jgi:hypothetical protein